MVSCDGAAVGCECPPLTMTPAHTKPANTATPPDTAVAIRQRECPRAFPAASVSLATSRNRRQWALVEDLQTPPATPGMGHGGTGGVPAIGLRHPKLLGTSA